MSNHIEQHPIIHQITPKDYPLLEDFLYHAIYMPPGGEMPKRELIFEPEIFVYIKDCGDKGDRGVIAEIDGKAVGSSWTRTMPAYGITPPTKPCTRLRKV